MARAIESDDTVEPGLQQQLRDATKAEAAAETRAVVEAEDAANAAAGARDLQSQQQWAHDNKLGPQMAVHAAEMAFKNDLCKQLPKQLENLRAVQQKVVQLERDLDAARSDFKKRNKAAEDLVERLRSELNAALVENRAAAAEMEQTAFKADARVGKAELDLGAERFKASGVVCRLPIAGRTMLRQRPPGTKQSWIRQPRSVRGLRQSWSSKRGMHEDVGGCGSMCHDTYIYIYIYYHVHTSQVLQTSLVLGWVTVTRSATITTIRYHTQQRHHCAKQ